LVLDAILVATYLILRRNYGWAGIVLSLTAIKPQLSITLLFFAVVWSVASGERRVRRLSYGLIGGLLSMEILSQIFLPGWEVYFYKAVQLYAHINGAEPGLWLLTGHKVIDVMMCFPVVVLMFAAWSWACMRPHSHDAVLAAVATSTLTTLLVVPRQAVSYYDTVFVILPVMAILVLIRSYGILKRLPALLVFALVLFWPMVSDAGPSRLQIPLHVLMHPFNPTLSFFLQSRMETSHLFYLVYVAPGLTILLLILVIKRCLESLDLRRKEPHGLEPAARSV
jgi:hypothetical protein